MSSKAMPVSQMDTHEFSRIFDNERLTDGRYHLLWVTDPDNYRKPRQHYFDSFIEMCEACQRANKHLEVK